MNGTVTRIDAHQHFWRFDPARDTWITDDMAALRRDFLPQDLESHLAATDIAGTIAVQADQSERETVFLLDLAKRHPLVRGVVGWVDLLTPDLDARLAHFAGFERFRGVRHIAQTEADDFLSRDDVIGGIARLREFGLTYDILVYAHQLPAALSLVERLPDQPFVVDHLAKPRIRDHEVEPWATRMRELARHENVWCKVSGMVTEANWAQWKPDDLRPYLDVVFEAFGPGRLMFGSDWPVCLVAARYPQVVEVIERYTDDLSAAERAQVLGASAARFYGVDS